MAQPKNPQDIEAKINAKAWKDPAFKKKLMSNPKAILGEMGFKVPDNIEVRIVEDTPKMFTFVVRTAPSDVQSMSDADLEKLAAGTCTRTAYGCKPH